MAINFDIFITRPNLENVVLVWLGLLAADLDDKFAFAQTVSGRKGQI